MYGDDLVPSRHGGRVPIRIAIMEEDMEYGYSGSYYPSTSNVSSRKAQKDKEMKANIPARTSMLKKLFDEDISLSHLPKLPLELWNIIAEHEGGVESSVLGDNTTNTSSWSWCSLSLIHI